ncbi:XRE family transcriptional regulator [Pseudomonas corrugata]|uniref:helix-turn-helix domain-containing protein n=1 Tax=Pseudomonas fluorescens group TaxID=136843 RepID=UPI0021BF27C9|nr:XRE family transcriptional regulator [Pseudomonas veronii]MCT9827277.1 XRE family transcriptional regulator [Pseudomonas veronii]
MSIESEIRNQRSLKGISLRALANTLGISASQLSKIETGKAKLTVTLALKIADILQVPASKFLSTGKPKATGRRTITRKQSGGIQTTPGMHLESLCSDFKEDHNLYWSVTIDASSFDDVGGWRQHPGQEFIFVVSGKLQLLSAFYDPVMLSAGDSILFDSDQPHAYVAVDGPANILMVNTVI